MIATKTLASLNNAITANLGDAFRTHLGASVVGSVCSRVGFYDFYWAAEDSREDLENLARLNRLWRRGDNEEEKAIEYLLAAGVEGVFIDPETEEQFLFSEYGGHYGGQTDGILWNVPDMPDVEMIFECKTHNKTNFNQLVKKGLQNYSTKYYNQCQIYMEKFGLKYCLHYNACKDDDRLHIEIVEFDPNVANRNNLVAENIITGARAPSRISDKPDYYVCNLCVRYKGVCKGGQEISRNCRTCEHIEVLAETGHWRCSEPMMRGIKKKSDQLAGCKQYRLNKERFEV